MMMEMDIEIQESLINFEIMLILIKRFLNDNSSI
ncbi:MAG: hypothetical protein XD54_0818 [Thermococcus sibiricus]|uniref:Uncharacterized protein n=1 Tax=Thermococcus sibiricus TaxID=172049 RepID=A0A101EM41_9EURY|nr:MAG: hypothetical protein XD54_0818 [Thermococcus sibiricus]